MAQEKELEQKFPKGLKLNKAEMENLKLKELVERYNLLMIDFAKEGFVLRPFINQGIEIMRVEKKGIDFNLFKKP